MPIFLKTQDIPTVPGWKLCSNCYKRVQVINEEVESNDIVNSIVRMSLNKTNVHLLMKVLNL